MARNKDTGPRKVAVPNIVNMTRTNANAALTGVGLVVGTQSASNTSNSSIDQQVYSQSIASGTLVLVGTTVDYSYYNYVYPGFGFYSPYYPGFYGGFGFYGNFGFYSTFSGFFGWSLETDAAKQRAAVYSEVDPLKDSPSYCVHEDTLIRTKDGLVRAGDITPGTTLKSMEIYELPAAWHQYDWRMWGSDSLTPTASSTTSVVSTSTMEVVGTVTINGDKFSTFHPILAKREGTVRFILSGDMQITDEVYEPDNGWTRIVSMTVDLEEPAKVVTFISEPYSIFFTEHLAVHIKPMV